MALVTTGTILGICPFLSEGFIQCVLLNREQNVLTQVYFQFASVRLYIPIAMVLVVYLLTYKLTFMNAELFMNLCSMVFAVFLAFCPPMPGWYVWIIPYVTLFFINVDQEKYKNITIYIECQLYTNTAYDKNRSGFFYGLWIMWRRFRQF